MLLERRRRQAVSGGYRLTNRLPAEDNVTLVGVGALMPEVLAAAELLTDAGVSAGVVCLTSPDLSPGAPPPALPLRSRSPCSTASWRSVR